MSLNRILAIDCGGSRSSAILIEDGCQAGAVRGPAANLHSAGADRVARAISAMTNGFDSAEALALSVAGLRTEGDREALLTALGRQGILFPVQVFSDVRAALRAGGVRSGVVVVAGTGSCALAVDDDGVEFRCGGWGRVLGDEGGGFWLGQSLLRGAVRALDEDEPSALEVMRVILEHLGLPDAHALRSLPAEPDAVESIASLAEVVARLGKSGNEEAQGLIRQTAAELGRLAALAAKRANLPDGAMLVVAGGLLRAFPDLPDLIVPHCPQLQPQALAIDSAWGAYWLAIERMEWKTPVPTREAVPTEADNAETEDIGSLKSIDILRAMNREDSTVPHAVTASLDSIAALVEDIVPRMGRGGRLIYVGAGTSGRLATLDAVECVPTFGIEPGRVVAVMAGGDSALVTAVEGVEDDADAGFKSIVELDVTDADTVIGVSASGGAPFVHGALRAAALNRAHTALITSNPQAAFEGLAQSVIVVKVGPEVISGSSRLKAGTAQKLVLNMLSTAVMIRLGRSGGNRMIGVRATNAKLRARAVGLVCEMTGAQSSEAGSALRSVGWDVTLAVLFLRFGDVTRARDFLAQYGENLAAALDASSLTPHSAGRKTTQHGRGEYLTADPD